MSKFLSSKVTKTGVHIIFWLLFLIIPLGFAGDMNIDFKHSLQHSLQRTLVFVFLFYLNYFFLIDKFLNTRKITLFVILNLLSISVVLFLKQGHYLDFTADGPPNSAPKSEPQPRNSNFIFYIDFLTYLIPVAAAVAIRLFQHVSDLQIRSAKESEELVQQELQYLKYQIQPHFFFNSLNNIYSLIDLDSEKAKESVHSLSKLMRYMLYRTENGKVQLKEEINFIEQYIALMKLRMRKNTTIEVDFPTQIPSVEIAPLLFISVVENAFKHGVSATEPSVLKFNLRIENNAISFLSENTNFPKEDTDESGSGIGVENLKKRLKLLYPNEHQFTYEVKNGRYYSKLRIVTRPMS